MSIKNFYKELKKIAKSKPSPVLGRNMNDIGLAAQLESSRNYKNKSINVLKALNYYQDFLDGKHNE